LFHHPADAEKWCEIQHTSTHDLEECRTYLDRKKVLEKPVTQEPRRGDHRRTNPNNDEQLDEINVIFGQLINHLQVSREEARARNKPGLAN
jgi:hypothetical protein